MHIMRTNIDIDDALMDAAMSSGQFRTKREAVEEGLRLIARREHAREVLRWEGKLPWNDQPDTDPLAPLPPGAVHRVMSPEGRYKP